MKRLVFSLMMAGLIGTSSVYAGGFFGDDDHKRGGWGKDGKKSYKYRDRGASGYGFIMSKDLDLSSNQKKEIEKALIDLRYSKYDGSRKDVSSYVENGVFNKEKFIADSKEQMNDFIAKRADVMEKVLNILTPEQKEKLSN